MRRECAIIIIPFLIAEGSILGHKFIQQPISPGWAPDPCRHESLELQIINIARHTESSPELPFSVREYNAYTPTRLYVEQTFGNILVGVLYGEYSARKETFAGIDIKAYNSIRFAKNSQKRNKWRTMYSPRRNRLTQWNTRSSVRSNSSLYPKYIREDDLLHVTNGLRENVQKVVSLTVIIKDARSSLRGNNTCYWNGLWKVMLYIITYKRACYLSCVKYSLQERIPRKSALLIIVKINSRSSVRNDLFWYTKGMWEADLFPVDYTGARSLQFRDYLQGMGVREKVYTRDEVSIFECPSHCSQLKEALEGNLLAVSTARNSACSDHSWYLKGVWKAALLTILTCFVIVLVFTYFAKIY